MSLYPDWKAECTSISWFTEWYNNTWLPIKGPLNDTQILNISKKTSLSAILLAQAVNSHIPESTVPKDLLDLIETNSLLSPLSLSQKTIVHQHLQHISATHLATLYNTNIANIYAAKAGRYNTQPPLTPPPSVHPYGPLTYEQKVHIFTECGHISTSKLAHEYNTHPSNIEVAKRGQFARKRDNITTILQQPYGPLTNEQKLDVHKNYQHHTTADIARIFNTSHMNAKSAKEGKFVSTDTNLTLARRLPQSVIITVASEILGIDLKELHTND